MSAPRGEQLVLAVDLGTGGPKVGLVTLTGALVWAEHVAVRTELLPGGGAVQDAEAWWQVILDAAGRALASGAARADRVVAVSCTGQWASTIPVAEDGTPVGDCVMWMDSRGGPHARRAVGGPVAGYAPLALWRFVRRSGGAPSIWGADPIGHMLFLEHDQPEVAARARWYLEPVDFLSMRFTGIAAASHASMTAAWLTDNRHLDRMRYDGTLVRAAGVPVDKLPPLVPTGALIGEVRAEVARTLGLRPGVVVVTGTPDLHSATVGSGAVLDYQGHMVISSTSWISCPVPMKKTDALHQIASIPGLPSAPGAPAVSGSRGVPGAPSGGGTGPYLVVDNHETAGLCLQWLRDNVMDGGGPGGFDALTALAARAPAGSGGALFTPWLAGERSPVDDRNARGGFHNLSLATGRAEMVRAVLEGVAYNSRWLNDAVERFVKRRLDPLRVIGGGAVSELWCQIHADVMDRVVERVAEPLHANLRGAALFAGLALGAVSLEEIPGLVRVDGRFAPQPQSRAVYDRLYEEFPRLYRAQKPMFARLNGHRSHSRTDAAPA